jgi:menaquinone-dependent protoporphyrinogen oxidase
MKCLVVYKGKYGTTEKTAQIIQELIGNNCDIKKLEKSKGYDIDSYDSIIIGTAVFAGHIPKIITDFFNKNKHLLKNKNFSIFIHASNDDQTTLELLKKTIGDHLFSEAKCVMPLGGRIQLNQHNFFMRQILKQVAKKSGKDFTNFDTTSRGKVVEFINRVRNNNYES